MIRWLKRLATWWRAPACPDAEILTRGDATFWDVAYTEEPIEPGRVEYRFLDIPYDEDES